MATTSLTPSLCSSHPTSAVTTQPTTPPLPTPQQPTPTPTAKKVVSNKPKTPTKERQPKHNWTWDEAVALVELVEQLGGNRYSVVAAKLNHSKKINVNAGQVQTFWKKLIDPSVSIFFKDYVRAPMPRQPPGTSDETIRANEAGHIAAQEKNAKIHAKMRSFLERSIARELVSSTNGENTEQNLLKAHIESEKHKKAVRYTRFKKLLNKTRREAKCREGAIKIIASEATLSRRNEQIQSLATWIACLSKEIANTDPILEKDRYLKQKKKLVNCMDRLEEIVEITVAELDDDPELPPMEEESDSDDDDDLMNETDSVFALRDVSGHFSRHS